MSTLKRLVLYSALLFSIFGQVCSTSCPAPIPCICDKEVIVCEKHAFSALVNFTYVKEDYHTLDFRINKVVSIPDAAFSSLNVSTILLDHNNISFVSPNAFQGLENRLKVLSLAHNRLKTLPEAIGNLHVIDDLDVSSNPINGYIKDYSHPHVKGTDGFTDSTMYAIGDSITHFTFGDTVMLTDWPKSLHHFQQLKKLHLDGSMIDMIFHGSFHGFEMTLRSLTIERARLKQIPVELGVFSQLEELHIDHNGYIGGDNIIIAEPFKELAPTLKTLSLKYDHLTVFPEVVKYLVNLKNLSVEGNMLEYISDDAVSFIKDTTVSILSFRNCGLKRIPGSISDLSNLLELDFSQNLLRSIENNDLQNLQRLQKITLASNPLKYISRNAFIGLNALTYLDLSHSNITIISEAIQNLNSLKWIDFSFSKIDCTCDLFWVKRWTVIYDRVITIYGNCETIDQSIQDYVDKRIPTCLQYLEP